MGVQRGGVSSLPGQVVVLGKDQSGEVRVVGLSGWVCQSARSNWVKLSMSLWRVGVSVLQVVIGMFLGASYQMPNWDVSLPLQL